MNKQAYYKIIKMASLSKQRELNKKAGLYSSLFKMIRKGANKDTVKRALAGSQLSRRYRNVNKIRHLDNLKLAEPSYDTRIALIGKYFKPHLIKNLSLRYLDNVNFINRLLNLKDQYFRARKQGLSKLDAYKQAKSTSDWNKLIFLFKYPKFDKELNNEDIEDLFMKYRDSVFSPHLKSTGSPIKMSDISSNSAISDPNYVYGAKAKEFISSYRKGKPLFMTPYLKLAIEYNGKPGYLYIFRAPRNKIKRGNKPALFTRHLGTVDLNKRIAGDIDLNASGYKTALLSPGDYLTVIDNTSGPILKLFTAYKKLSDNTYQPYRISPISDKVLKLML